MNLSIDDNWYSYRKIFLNNDTRNIAVKVSNYEIPKNCPYELLTKDVYIIGYTVKTDYGDIELPIFSKTHGKKHSKVINQLKKYSIQKVLRECNFPEVAIIKILIYI